MHYNLLQAEKTEIKKEYISNDLLSEWIIKRIKKHTKLKR